MSERCLEACFFLLDVKQGCDNIKKKAGSRQGSEQKNWTLLTHLKEGTRRVAKKTIITCKLCNGFTFFSSAEN